MSLVSRIHPSTYVEEGVGAGAMSVRGRVCALGNNPRIVKFGIVVSLDPNLECLSRPPTCPA